MSAAVEQTVVGPETEMGKVVPQGMRKNGKKGKVDAGATGERGHRSDRVSGLTDWEPSNH